MQSDTYRSPHGAARIRALTDTAAELFLERGDEGVSVDDPITRAGGSRRDVYDRFGGKHGLFIDIVTRLCDEQALPLRNPGIAEGEIGPALVLFGERVPEIVLRPRPPLPNARALCARRCRPSFKASCPETIPRMRDLPWKSILAGCWPRSSSSAG